MNAASRDVPSDRSLALWAAALFAAACVAVSVSYRIYDPDLWQNLTVGKAIWQLHRVPTTQLWSWPTYGAPDVNWTWGFSALLWPVWAQGGVVGLFAWRWVTALAAFALLWAAARRLGARGFLPLAVMVLCSLVWRGRSQVSPRRWLRCCSRSRSGSSNRGGRGAATARTGWWRSRGRGRTCTTRTSWVSRCSASIGWTACSAAGEWRRGVLRDPRRPRRPARAPRQGWSGWGSRRSRSRSSTLSVGARFGSRSTSSSTSATSPSSRPSASCAPWTGARTG